MAAELLGDDAYKNMLMNQLWQQQLSGGANIANTGWKTALGLNLGTLLGNWLGYKFGNWQQARDDNRRYGKNSPQETAINNLLGSGYDLGWTPPEEPYRFGTPQEYLWDSPRLYNQDWRQRAIDNAFKIPPWSPQVSNTPNQQVSQSAQPRQVPANFNLSWKPSTEPYSFNVGNISDINPYSKEKVLRNPLLRW